METAGLFDQQRLELIAGELINKMGVKRPHVNAVGLLFGGLIQVFGIGFVNTEAPIEVAPEDNPTSQPQPDLIVLKRSSSQLTTPQPEDLDLVLEVADTTLTVNRSSGSEGGQLWLGRRLRRR